MEPIISEVKRLLGLNSYEAKAYLTLIMRGASKATVIARESGIPQQRIYDVLRSLESKGLIVEDGGIYIAIDPRDALRAFSGNLVAEALERSRQIGFLAEKLSKIASSYAREYVKLVTGVSRSIGEALAILESCENQPVFTALKSLERIEEFWPHLKRLVEASKKPPLVFIPCDSNIPEGLLKEAEDLGVVIRKIKCVPMDMMIACDTVILGLPSRVNEVISVVAKNHVFSDAVLKRIREIGKEEC